MSMDSGSRNISRITVLVIALTAFLFGMGVTTYGPRLLERIALIGGEKPIACTLEAKICPDGTAVGRSGPNCEFAACPAPSESEKDDLIRVEAPLKGARVSSPLVVRGEARGMWYFEATFPIVIVNWDGLIIGEGYAEATSDWMTEEYVPFTGTIEFDESLIGPYARGAVIFRKDNPSGLPEHDNALEVPIVF